MEKITVIDKFQCNWCHKEYNEEVYAYDCWDGHIQDFSEMGHPFDVGTKLVCRKESRCYDLPCKIVRVEGELNNTRYLLEWEDGERLWKRWWDDNLKFGDKQWIVE